MSNQAELTTEPSANLLSFAQRLARATLPLPKADRRATERQLYFAEPAVLVPVDELQEPCGEPLQAVTRDISLPSGLGLIVEESPSQERYVVQFTAAGRESNLLVEVKWHKPMGPFYYVGLQALERLSGPIV